jgi:hypothetical protein
VDEVRDTFVKALGDEPLRVLLSIEAPDLRALDWRRLAAPFDGRWRLLAVQQNTPFSLSVPSPASAHFPALGRRNLRALVLVAGPESLSGDYKLAPFDVTATIASAQTASAKFPATSQSRCPVRRPDPPGRISTPAPRRDAPSHRRRASARHVCVHR